MKFDADVRAGDSRAGLFFDPSVSEPIDGVIALYYTDELQFISNPFSPRDLEPLRQFLPMSMELWTARARARRRLRDDPGAS